MFLLRRANEETDLAEFENLFHGAVQSNSCVMCDGTLEVIAETVRAPGGIGKQKKKNMLKIIFNEVPLKKSIFCTFCFTQATVCVLCGIL